MIPMKSHWLIRNGIMYQVLHRIDLNLLFWEVLSLIQIAICDDSEATLQHLNQAVTTILQSNQEVADITLYSKSENLSYDIKEGHFFDLILTDIEMPHMNGMELAATIRTHLPGALIIFMYRKLLLKDILYISREGKNSVFHLTNQTEVKERKSLNPVIEGLNSSDFVFADRGIIVNLIHIVSIQDTTIELDNGEFLPASLARIKELKLLLQKIWRNSL